MTRILGHILLFVVLVAPSMLSARNLVGTPVEEPTLDTLISVAKVEITAIKQSERLRKEPLASSVIGERTISMQGVNAIKDVLTDVPNLFMPNYGSRTTSSIYVRGMGARIDQPVVGMNVDNVPIADKNLYDTELSDIKRIEFLRGPQATLYGRNTMGGVINIYTLSPLEYQGVRLRAEYGSRNAYRFSASTYNRLGEGLGLSISGQYAHNDGYYRNDYTGRLCDKENSGNIRTKFQLRKGGFSLDNTIAFSAVEQGGYPYEYIGSPNPEKHREELVGKINYNEPCSYERYAVSEGLSLRYDFGKMMLSSLTSYQYLDDKMHIDNDFLPEDYFTLEQCKQQHDITEDIVLRSHESGKYRWLVGLYAFHKDQQMQAPVTFGRMGIEQLILKNVNNYYPGEYRWGNLSGEGGDSFLLDSRFSTRNSGVALYHRSELHLGRWQLALGLRLDYEAVRMNYNTSTSTCYSTFPFDTNYPATEHHLNISDSDILKRGFLEFLPSFSVSVDIDERGDNMLYLSASKGYKAGGFNTQMFSEVLQRRVQNEMGLYSEIDIDKLCAYDPEHSYNLELGGHFATRNEAFTADVALFYIECIDQQLTIFPDENSTGRMMTNAGRTRSLGGEISLSARLAKTLRLNASYGYTNARFREFKSGGVDYAGKYIPYCPQNSLSLRLSQMIPLQSRWLNRIVLNVGTTGAGRIYWNEANDVSQPLYLVLDGSVRFEGRWWGVDFWCRNATNTRYDTFYFESMGNRFVQRGRGVTGGVRVMLNILEKR